MLSLVTGTQSRVKTKTCCLTRHSGSDILARPDVEVRRIADFGNIEIEAESLAEIIEGTKEVEKIVIAREIIGKL